MSKTAVITGGASGIGLAVASILASQGTWHIHLLDINEESGQKATQKVKNSTFHKADVADYASLGPVFKSIFDSSATHGIDFVFANAGVVERQNFYAPQSTTSGPPPPPDLSPIDVNLVGVINTSHLAMHYFRISPHKGKDANLVITASCGAIYPWRFLPMYSASKHGVIGFMRSIASQVHSTDGIRVNAVCPGGVRTELVRANWDTFPSDLWTSCDKISEIVVSMVGGQSLTDEVGVTVEGGDVYGRAVEVSGEKFYFREKPAYCDDIMARVMEM